MKTLKFYAWTAISILSTGCATHMFTVNSEPPQAEVYFQAPGSTEKKPIGKTPIKMPMSELQQIMGEEFRSGQYFPVTVEFPGYIPETLQIPATRFGTLVTAIDVKLKEGTVNKEEKTAKAVLDQLFLAQKFALSQQFERAHIEIDKILAVFPTFARALSMRASVHYAQKNLVESLKWYEEAIKADPQMDDAVKMAAKIRALQSGRSPAAAAAPATARGAGP